MRSAVDLPVHALDGVLPGAALSPVADADLDELLVLQRACWVQEAIANDTLAIPALHESRADLAADMQRWTTLVVRHGGRLVASVRGEAEDGIWEVGRLMVAPDLAGRGVGSALLAVIESLAPAASTRFELFTGVASDRNIRTYERAGYVVQPRGDLERRLGTVRLAKARGIA